MTDLVDLLARLAALDVRLTLAGDKLSINAPKGALSEALRAELGRCKDDLKAHLRANPPADAPMPAAAPALVRVPRRAHMPVSHTQQRLWFLRQMDPGSSTYNVATTFRMTGRLDVQALERAMADLVERHETLRTHFVSVDGTPCCSVEAEARVPLKFIDLGAMTEPAREAAGLREMLATALRPFDLGRGPLMHLTLVRLAPELHLFCLSVDHIAADGVSLGMLFFEMQALYTQYVRGKPANLPALPLQYLDYADWQRRSLAGGALDRHLAHWQQQLRGLPPALSLPTDRPRPRVQSFNGSRTLVTLSLELGGALKTFAQQEGATLYMLMLAGFEILLHRYSGAEDFTVGSAVAARNRPEVERVVGFFANNIVQRADLSGRPTVRQLLARVREVALKAYAHQDMPFDLLVETLAPRRDLGHSPLFQVLFVLHQMMVTRSELAGVICEVQELPLTTARFDLSADVFDLPDGLRIYFEYNTDLFDLATVERMLGHYRRLLQGMIERPDAAVGDLPMLDDDECRRQSIAWTGPTLALPPEQTLHGLFEVRAAQAPDAPALQFESTTLAYGELNARANQLAHRLRTLGVGRESLVGVWMERSAEMVIAMLGVLKAGGAYVPLDPGFPQERIDYMMADAELAVVVTQSRLAATLPAGGPHALCLDTDAASLARQPTQDPVPLAAADNLAYVIYTSGSTGKPKGVMLEHRSVVNFLLSMQREPGLGPDDRFVSVTTLSFDIAGLEIHGPLTTGGTVVLATRATALDGERLAALLESSRATVLQATPATWRLLIDSGWRGRTGLKMLCGGEALPRDLADKLLGLGGALWNLYGPTETTIWSTLERVTDSARAIPIGRPIANTQVYVLEPSGLPAPTGVGGELCIGGAGLARGYRGRTALTAEKFVTLDLPGVGATRVYRTGDIVRWLADGRLEFVGRRDHQVKVRGFRIELGEIESVLATHSGLKDNVVQVREDNPGDQRLVAYVVPAAAIAFDADAARATLRTQLPEYMIPNHFVTLQALPLTPNGKVDRQALPPPEHRVAATEAANEMVMTPVQRQVAGLWRDVLRVDSVGLHANFFDLGGHSLLLVKLQSALQREFGRELPLVELFQRTTVAAQAERYAAPTASNAALQRAQARAARQGQA